MNSSEYEQIALDYTELSIELAANLGVFEYGPDGKSSRLTEKFLEAMNRQHNTYVKSMREDEEYDIMGVIVLAVVDMAGKNGVTHHTLLAVSTIAHSMMEVMLDKKHE